MKIKSRRLEKEVDEFVVDMKSRLAEKERVGYKGWDDLGVCLTSTLIDDINLDAEELTQNPTRKLCADIANRCMMVSYRLNKGIA